MKFWKTSLIKQNKHSGRVILLAGALSLAAVVLSLCLGAVRLTPAELWQSVTEGPSGGMGSTIFWYSRLPRTAAALLAGAALSVSGAVIQSVLANKLASPSIIGVNAGAGLAVTICCALGAYSGWLVAGASFFGALSAVLLVTFAARRTGASRTTVILAGVAVNSILNALSEGVLNLFPDAASMTADFRVGGFSSVAHSRLIPAGVLILLALGTVFTLCNELDVLALGGDAAQGLGLPVKQMRTLLLLLSAMLAGAAVSFGGLLGFVGLIVPHAARTLVGSESRRLLPFCAVAGGGFVTLCDLLARLVFAPYELPVGILLSVLGGPFFLILLLKRRGGRTE